MYLARIYADLFIIQKSNMSSTLMSLVPVLDGSMNWQAWRPMMMNYLLSQGQWKVITLGTRTQIPTRHMLDTLGVQTTSDSNVPSGYRLGTF